MIYIYLQEFLQVVEYLANQRGEDSFPNGGAYKVQDILQEVGIPDYEGKIAAHITSELVDREIVNCSGEENAYLSLNDLGMKVWKMYSHYKTMHPNEAKMTG